MRLSAPLRAQLGHRPRSPGGSPWGPLGGGEGAAQGPSPLRSFSGAQLHSVCCPDKRGHPRSASLMDPGRGLSRSQLGRSRASGEVTQHSCELFQGNRWWLWPLLRLGVCREASSRVTSKPSHRCLCSWEREMQSDPMSPEASKGRSQPWCHVVSPGLGLGGGGSRSPVQEGRVGASPQTYKIRISTWGSRC